MSNENVTKKNVKIPEELHNKVKIAATEEKTTIEQFISTVWTSPDLVDTLLS